MLMTSSWKVKDAFILWTTRLEGTPGSAGLYIQMCHSVMRMPLDHIFRKLSWLAVIWLLQHVHALPNMMHHKMRGQLSIQHNKNHKGRGETSDE